MTAPVGMPMWLGEISQDEELQATNAERQRVEFSLGLSSIAGDPDGQP